MTEPSAHINYSLEDIQRYLQGKMPAAEMHNIEKAALQDPFLADAIEGFNHVDFATAKEHLNTINASLFSEKQKAKVVAFNVKTRWLNIAAIIIVIAGLGVISMYLLKNPGKQQQVAQVKNQPANQGILTDSVAGNINTSSASQDTSTFIAQAKNIEEPSTKKLSSSNKKINKADVAADKKNNDKTNIASIASAPSAKEKENVLMPALTNKAMDTSQTKLMVMANTSMPGEHIFNGKIVDENNKPIPFVTIESDDKRTAVITNIKGDFTIQKKDSIVNVTASTIGFATKNINLKPGNNAPVVLQGTNAGLNEVVVVGYGAAKKIKGISDSAMPVGGWQNFNNYVMTQLNKDTTAQPITSPNDVVELEFFIDNLGNPYNIKIVKSPDDEKTAKAIQILKNGPKWSHASKKKKAKVSIPF